MKSNRMMWVLVTLVVLTTMAITFGTRDSRSQEKVANQIQPTPANPIDELKKDYPRVDYYDNRSTDPERQKEVKNMVNIPS